MTERPILFSGAMVRALLEGEKTQTRRVIGQSPLKPLNIGCRYGTVGDQLWVREAWNLARALRDCEGIVDDEQLWTGPLPKQDPRGKRVFDDWCVGYAADGGPPPWRPSIHMPRWASRITLDVTAVRIERLQHISEDDACAEGCLPISASPPKGFAARDQFQVLWDSINGKRPGCTWADNPWVWVVEFRRLP